ncbi:hypothetical protein OCU04_012645 [Sclerotinia nivalis]|uniref:Uncharacterized protein n=1 Tax=Sclerotinia nivalis TaxID=352851 RepID=A0A9X0DEC0_9HELO|nr:hypothetical protein OCU04_012645 [Sclerotinia nivalis]
MLWKNYNGQTIRDVYFRHTEYKKLSGKDDFKSIVVQASGLIQTGVDACFRCQNYRSPYPECIKVSADQVTNLGVWAQSCGGCVWSNQHPGCSLRTTGPSAKSKPYCFGLIGEVADAPAGDGASSRAPAADEDDNDDDDAARQLLRESGLRSARYDLRNAPLYRCIDQ